MPTRRHFLATAAAPALLGKEVSRWSLYLLPAPPRDGNAAAWRVALA